jgi:hypothetical protein
MKRALSLIAASAAVYAIAAWWAAAQLPDDRVPMHVNTAGQVDRYGSRASAISSFIGLGSVLLVLAVGCVFLCRFVPVKWLNIPHKEYWTDPQRTSAVRQMIVWDMAVFFGIPLLALSSVPINIALMSRNPAGVSALWIIGPIGVMVVALVGYAIWVVTRRYRPPASE